MRRSSAQLARARRRISAEGGFALFEAVMSAALMVIVGVGVLAGIDGPAAVSSTNQARSEAADLAQQDQERLRAFRVSDLYNYQNTQTVTVGDVNYKVTSRADWVTDKSGMVSCTSSSSQADYLQISSTVTWPSIGAARPVALTSLLAPPPQGLSASQGSVALQIQDQAGNGVAGVPVNLSGPGSGSLSTNSAGCALFGYMTPGSNYQFSFSLPNYVDLGGNNVPPMPPSSVTAGQTNVVTVNYAQAATIPVTFSTPGSAATPTAVSISAVNAGVPGGGVRTFTSSTPASTINASGLYPFTSGYGIYAGSCASNAPDKNGQPAAPVAMVTPGGTATPITVVVPAINIVVKNSGGAVLQNAHVTVTPTGGCTDVYPAQATSASGALPVPGYPYGNYTVCADDRASHSASVPVQNNNPNGTASTPIRLPAVANGNCP